MKKKLLAICVSVVALAIGATIFAREEHAPSTAKWPAFAEFRGFQNWPVIAISQNGGKVAAILGNPAIMAALRSGIPGNGKPFPNGSRIAKIHWIPKTQDRKSVV